MPFVQFNGFGPTVRAFVACHTFGSVAVRGCASHHCPRELVGERLVFCCRERFNHFGVGVRVGDHYIIDERFGFAGLRVAVSPVSVHSGGEHVDRGFGRVGVRDTPYSGERSAGFIANVFGQQRVDSVQPSAQIKRVPRVDVTRGDQFPFDPCTVNGAEVPPDQRSGIGAARPCLDNFFVASSCSFVTASDANVM